jgi:hypothetical protein
MNSKQYFLVRSNDRFDSYKRQLNTINNILLDTLYYLDEEEYCYFIDYEKNKDNIIDVKLPKIPKDLSNLSRRTQRYCKYLMSEIESMVQTAQRYGINIRYIY